MFENARHWRLLAGGVAAGLAGVVGFAGNTASADPLPPQPVVPAPATVTQTVTVQAAPAPVAAAQPAGPAFIPAGQPAAVPQPATLPQPAVAQPVIAPAPPPTPAIAPAASGTIAEFFRAHNVAMQRQTAAGFTALNIVLPVPPGWAAVPDPNVPDAFAVIADRVGGDGLYTSNAALQVYKLVGDFDPREAISHGFIDSQQQVAWRSTDGSMADFYGMPSSIIEGTYRENNLTLNTSRRHVIATSGADRYLVTLSVTTSAQVTVASGNATDAIVNGFKISAPGAPAAVPAPVAPAPAAPMVPAPAAVAPHAAGAVPLTASIPGLGR
ncbi:MULTISPECIES: LpqN/LpqT family lipoprotein [unclassified Mycobacterium]|uniref:LpqN/LpqT family lipoprotein n=1 Tax=unclassified Mycobacterium TaxID=2642494 RepID=UPI00048ABFB3|nr:MULTISPECIES: LpqN/LpqT family lipoprotein [unclassified Mycobacterium]SEB17585.1 Probable lipoprotein LpqN [Mycobacterium sp. 283mftsu]